MVNIVIKNNQLLLKYQDSRNDPPWVDKKLNEGDTVNLSKVFTFTKKDLIEKYDPSESGERVFILGNINNADYYKIHKDILGINNDLLLHKEMKIDDRTFIANGKISIFKKINTLLIDEPIIIGGNHPNAISQEDFERLLKDFPTRTELDHYARSRITRILKDYFGTMSDAENKLNQYLKKKAKTAQEVMRKSEIEIKEWELEKFEYIFSELQEMIDTEKGYKENDWQKKILQLFPLIFPKYIAVLEKVSVSDFYSKSNETTKREIDIVLVDFNGNIDIVEIKQPSSNNLLSRGKYRDNYTQGYGLRGAVMQAEKYLFHLSKWGHDGEKKIYEKYKDNLPEDIKLKITNPKALILLGRDKDFDKEQRFDFEIIRRQYANMMDIITYDDLLKRLENTIAMIKKRMGNQMVSSDMKTL